MHLHFVSGRTTLDFGEGSDVDARQRSMDLGKNADVESGLGTLYFIVNPHGDSDWRTMEL